MTSHYFCLPSSSLADSPQGRFLFRQPDNSHDDDQDDDDDDQDDDDGDDQDDDDGDLRFWTLIVTSPRPFQCFLLVGGIDINHDILVVCFVLIFAAWVWQHHPSIVVLSLL